MPGFVNDKEHHYVDRLSLEAMPVKAWRLAQYKRNPYFFLVRYRDFAKIDYIQEKIIKFAKQYQNFYIVLNDSFEGYAYKNFCYVQEFVKTNNLENKVVFMCGHLDSEKEYAAWCNNHSLTQDFKVVSYNIFFSSAQYEYPRYANFTTEKSKWFCCLNHRPHPQRVATVTYLDYLNMLDDGIVTLHNKSYEDGTPFSNYAHLVLSSHQLWHPTYYNILKNQYPHTQEKLPLIYDKVHVTEGGHPDTFSSDIYNSCLMNLITETFYLNCLNFYSETFLTEKTLRAILAKQIFIIVGPRGILKRLRELGFKTFSDFFDESYDDQPDATRLFTAIDTLNGVIKKYDIAELNEKTAHIRDHNLQVLMNTNFNINLKDRLGL